jgi:hypothetical protein
VEERIYFVVGRVIPASPRRGYVEGSVIPANDIANLKKPTFDSSSRDYFRRMLRIILICLLMVYFSISL